MNSIKKRIAIILTPLILLFAVKIDVKDKFSYLIESLLTFAPIAIVFRLLDFWYENDTVMAISLFVVLFANMVIGAYFHYKRGTFDISDFLQKNGEMLLYTGGVYLVLYLMDLNIKDDFGPTLFLPLAQAISLFYPVSKICKNIFILSDGKHPPEFLMQKLYNFEKNGDLNEFFNPKNKEQDA